MPNQYSLKHGMTCTSEFHIWANMRYRCNNPKSKDYKDYGARGIKIDPRWDSFAQFYADMGPRPSRKHSIDRINNDGPYSSENCRWATQSTQRKNSSYGRLLTLRGVTKNAIDWAIELGLSYPVLVKRINRGWDDARALTTPKGAYTKHA